MLEGLPAWAPIVVIATILAIIVGFGQGTYWAWVSRRQAEQERIARRLGTVQSEEQQASLFRESLPDPTANALGNMGSHLRDLLVEAALPWSVSRFLFTSAGIAAVVGLFGFLILGPPALVLGMIAGLVPYIVVGQRASKRSRQIIEQLPEALDLMARSLQAGLGLSDSFKLCAEELPLPLAGEFGRVFEEIRFGRDYRTALGGLLRRNPRLFELRMFVSSVLLQRETGGNLIEVLNSISNTIRSRFLFHAKVKALTSEARFSALILGGLPLGVLVVLYVTNPSYLMPLFTDVKGYYMLGFMFIMYSSGGFLMYRISQVEV
jgi:tight adherence protein B